MKQYLCHAVWHSVGSTLWLKNVNLLKHTSGGDLDKKVLPIKQTSQFDRSWTWAKMKSFVLVLGVLAVAQCNPAPISKEENVLKNVIGSISECVNSDVDVCLKVRGAVSSSIQ